MKIHSGDSVLIISGKDKGKTGSVVRVIEDQNRVVVTGINMRTRHLKKTYQQAGRILKYEASISASNVMILDPKTKKPSRIGYKIDDKGKKIRISKVSGEEVKVVKAKVEKKVAKKEAEVIEAKKSKKEADATDATPGKKSPFWKKMGFGSTVEGTPGEVKEGAHSQQDHTVPQQQSQTHRSGGRGS